MKVRLLYFASFRDELGRKEETREIPAGSRVSDLWAALCAGAPRLREFASVPPAAVNCEYVPPHTPLSENDEVAFLPPVAGG